MDHVWIIKHQSWRLKFWSFDVFVLEIRVLSSGTIFEIHYLKLTTISPLKKDPTCSFLRKPDRLFWQSIFRAFAVQGGYSCLDIRVCKWCVSNVYIVYIHVDVYRYASSLFWPLLLALRSIMKQLKHAPKEMTKSQRLESDGLCFRNQPLDTLKQALKKTIEKPLPSRELTYEYIWHIPTKRENGFNHYLKKCRLVGDMLVPSIGI